MRRSAGMVRYAGEAAEMVEDDTKSSKPRVVDIDAGAAAVLRAWKAERGGMAFALAKPDALVFGHIEGGLPQRRARLPSVRPRCGALPGGTRRRGGARDPLA